MTTILLLLLIAILVVRWIYLRERLNDIERRIQELAKGISSVPRPVTPPSAPQAAAAPISAPPPAPNAAPAPPAPLTPPQVTAAPPHPAVPPTPSAAPPHPAVPPAFSFPRPAPRRSGEEWEALLGGNWLNKLGVLVLVIGIALALAYSYKLLGPAGRVGLSLAISFAMLGAGVAVESREPYRVFARGLIGGGWAALYFTVYAMQALEPARVIYNPWTGALLLLAVAAGMILHSLRYRSQTVTGLAYFIGFVTLAITQMTSLSLSALIPLAASLLYIARRFRWSRMALFGLVATYWTCGTRPDTGAPLWEAQTIFAIYWLLFEFFDLVAPEPWLAGLNAIGFLALSVYKWQAVAPGRLWQFFAGAAAAYLAGAILRARAGRWHWAITVTAALAAAATFLKLEGQWIALGLLIEGELLYLAGVRLRAPYLRTLAGFAFAAQVAQLAAGEIVTLPVDRWMPVAVAGAACFYLNRALQAEDIFYGYAGAALAATAAGFEIHNPYRPTVWLLMALAPFAFGWFRRLIDFRMQGYLLALAGLVGAVIDASRLSFAMAAAVSYGLTFWVVISGDERCDDSERDLVPLAGSVAAVLSMAALLWREVPAEYLGVSWMAVALLLLELGMRGLPKHLCREAYALAAVGAVLNYGPWEHRWIPAAAAALAYAIAVRARKEENGIVWRAGSLVGTGFAMAAAWALLPGYQVAAAWAAFALLLVAAERQWGFEDLGLQSCLVAALAFARCWYTDLEGAIPVMVCLYAAQFASPRGSWQRAYRSIAATTLTTLWPYFHVAGYLRTVVWGIEGMALLGSGFPLRERVLRLSGLMVLMGCILKLFFWDLRHLETMPRIFSFILLGLFLVGVSWIYTRFRERVAQFL